MFKFVCEIGAEESKRQKRVGNGREWRCLISLVGVRSSEGGKLFADGWRNEREEEGSEARSADFTIELMIELLEIREYCAKSSKELTIW